MEIKKAEIKDLNIVVKLKMDMFTEVGSIALLQDNAEELLQWLKIKGVHNIKLKPSAVGKRLYEKFGFYDSGEMELWI